MVLLVGLITFEDFSCPQRRYPDLIGEAQTTEERFLRHIFVRDQMAEWSKSPLVMAKADGVFYWDVTRQALPPPDALSGIYVVSVGSQQPPGNSRSWKRQLTAVLFSAPMHGTPTVACSSQTCWRSWPRRPVGRQVPSAAGPR